ncbi:MAG: type II toxin-antitoxin system VapB family antitoxin [Thermoleophilia bacterium]|nr:type II toxin-antitoxin system VapB family antitoxin [Thermoleophilia bacterium]
MALTIKNTEVERLAEEVARLSGQSKTQALRQALEEKRDRLVLRVSPAARATQRRRFLEREIWADIPDELLGRPHDRALDDEILGYGADGV